MTTTLTPPTEPTDPREVAREVIGWQDLRPHQVAAIEATVAGRDVVAVVTVFFQEQGYRTLSPELIRERDLLTRA